MSQVERERMGLGDGRGPPHPTPPHPTHPTPLAVPSYWTRIHWEPTNKYIITLGLLAALKDLVYYLCTTVLPIVGNLMQWGCGFYLIFSRRVQAGGSCVLRTTLPGACCPAGLAAGPAWAGLGWAAWCTGGPVLRWKVRLPMW